MFDEESGGFSQRETIILSDEEIRAIDEALQIQLSREKKKSSKVKKKTHLRRKRWL